MMVFVASGSVDMTVLPDLLEEACRGPLLPDAVLLFHLAENRDLAESLAQEPAQSAMVRFQQRLPLLRVEISGASFRLRVHGLRSPTGFTASELEECLNRDASDWIAAGLGRAFEANRVLAHAPSGYAFQKPSGSRSTYFIRAETGLSTSGAISFVALSVLRHLLLSRGGVPSELKVLFVDTMGVATVAYALRDLLRDAGLRHPPQIESFHSYDGLDLVKRPLPGATLCLISASSSMNMHRDWVAEKRVPDRDVLTLVTFDDVEDREHALFRLPGSLRPKDETTTAKHDIRIEGENFFPSNEPPRKILISKTHHAFDEGTSVFRELIGEGAFDLFGGSSSSPKRHGIFIHGDRLAVTPSFVRWLEQTLEHRARAITRQVLYQEDAATRTIAELIAAKLTDFGLDEPRLVPFDAASADSIEASSALIAVSAVATRGSAILSLSQRLRNLHKGPRLYLIGMQIAEDGAKIRTFDSNLTQSAHRAAIEVFRYRTLFVPSAVAGSFKKELDLLYDADGLLHAPPILAARAGKLRQGVNREPGPVLLPGGSDLDVDLALNEDFAFWEPGYSPGPYQCEVVGTFAAILERARHSVDVEALQRLSSPMLQQVALSPENFTRFDDDLIHASILRSALPSELDYRGDSDASAFMCKFLCRMADRLGRRPDAVLEFLTALAIDRLQLKTADKDKVVDAFSAAASGGANELSKAVAFLVNRVKAGKQGHSGTVF